MKKGWVVPPDCCVIIEVDQGASLGYRKASLLNGIKALGSLGQAAMTSQIDAEHARDLIFEMNEDFRQPLVVFEGNAMDCDPVQLTEKGELMASLYWQKYLPVWQSILDERSSHY